MSIEFLLTSLVVVLMPGTGALYTVSIGLFIGARASIAAAAGCTLSIVPSLMSSVLGLAVIIHTSAIAFQIIKYAGAIYLLYLAWSMWKSNKSLSLNEENQQQSMLTIALRGFLINALNPKLTIFFLAFLPQFLPINSDHYTANMLALGTVFMLMTLGIFILYGLLATGIRDYLIHSQRTILYIKRLFAGSFALLGAKLALTSRE